MDAAPKKTPLELCGPLGEVALASFEERKHHDKLTLGQFLAGMEFPRWPGATLPDTTAAFTLVADYLLWTLHSEGFLQRTESGWYVLVDRTRPSTGYQPLKIEAPGYIAGREGSDSQKCQMRLEMNLSTATPRSSVRNPFADEKDKLNVRLREAVPGITNGDENGISLSIEQAESLLDGLLSALHYELPERRKRFGA